MSQFQTRLDIAKSKKNPDILIFTVTTPTLRTQFKLPKKTANQLRVDLEKLLLKK
ncbi:MAG: hypothetical protein K9L95_01485 [Candidatus Omnitrophica bacterium]|nr:hypothetical protein [Candidatus Omnitrophota bacterium]MCF7876832.1 hypothetical protein [Candidatus Omnitrophota bacterium]MCF7878127.1 hypothetical protein [Candidatus Omnitrophota bacterium]MCF7892968.1 hypothetical protein [Candidatus Omnitrophota bacterium]